MRQLAIVFSVLMLTPTPALAQDALPAAPAPESAPAEGDLGLYVGVGLGSNLSLGGGSFGYQLEASVGFFYRMLALEVLGGTTTVNGDQLASVGPHLGGAVRVSVVDAESVGLQLGLGVRHHSARAETGADDRYTGGFVSLRLLLPLTDDIRVRIDSELEHVFDAPMSGASSNRLMFGFGVETRVAP